MKFCKQDSMVSPGNGKGEGWAGSNIVTRFRFNLRVWMNPA
jgi:hypothetical protein